MGTLTDGEALMSRDELSEPHDDLVNDVQLKVRALVGKGVPPEQIASRLGLAGPGRGALEVIVSYEVARAALETARERLNLLLGAGEGERSSGAPAKARRVVGPAEPGEAGSYGVRREAVMAQARARVRELAGEGLPAGEIQARLDYRLTGTERELIIPIIREEVAAARRARMADSLGLGGNQVA